MNCRKSLKILFYLNVILVAVVLGYKAYLNFFLPKFEGVHSYQIERIDERLVKRQSFSFAVVGNINNSIGMFQNRMIPVLNAAGLDFLISAGNAVSSGGEDKYQALFGTLSHLTLPYLLTFGDHEHSTFGSYRFYEHFGSHYFSFHAGDTRFIFLDSTGKTSWRWQIRWLKDLLEQDNSSHRLVFISHPFFRHTEEIPFDDENDYLQPELFREALLSLFREHHVDAVFSANVASFTERQEDGTRYVITGGAGGLMLGTDNSFYHYVRVTVSTDGVAIEPVSLDTGGQHPILRRLEGLWFFVYSLFYVGYLNFILLVSALMLITHKLYTVVFQARDYYPNYDLDPTPWLNKPVRIAMFTNTFLPFVGGVPLSVERLRRGLEKQGDQVLVVAPRYHEQPEPDPHVLLVPSLLSLGKNREFRVANIFLGRIRARVRAFRPDVIHLHHPFWLGSLGLLLARWFKVPALYTYHTRLEHFAPFVPLPSPLFRNLVSHALIRRFANKCEGVIVPTSSAEEYLRMIGVKSPTFVQPTGIDYERFQQVEKTDIVTLRESLGLTDEIVLISVSRLSKEKNIDFMMDAVDTLRHQTDRPFRVLMIGDGQEHRHLQKRIDQMELNDRFTLVGEISPDDMATWYRLGDVFLFASRSETQGLVILEAMAAGLPVVAVRSSGIDDVVREGYNGFKTLAKTELWRERVRLLLENDTLRDEMSANALAFARDYSVERFALDVKKIYATILAGASGT